MSKRFGRNQKRKMREALLASEAGRALDSHLILAMRQKLNDHMRFLGYIIEIVGPDSVINPEPRLINMRGEGSSFRVPIYPTLSHIQNMDARSLEQVRDTIVHVLETHVAQGTFDDAVHFCVRLRNGDFAYALSDRAIAMMPMQELTDRLHQNISQLLAHQLARELKR